MKFFCPQCGQKLACNDDEQGPVVSCPNCSNEITVPTLIKQAKPYQVEEKEIVLISGRPSKLYHSYLLILSFLFGIFCVIKLLPPALNGDIPFPIFFVDGIAIVPFLVSIFIFLAKIKSHSFVLTNKRLTVTGGIAFNQEDQVRVSDIRAITVRRWLWDFVCKTGTISLGTAATLGREINLRNIKYPEKIVEKIEELRKQVK